MQTLYNAVLGTIIRYGLGAWFGLLTVQCKSTLANIVKTSMKIIGSDFQPLPLEAVYEGTIIKQATKILQDPFQVVIC